MNKPRILLFDSGMGGLTVASAVAKQLPNAHLIYSADNAGFPYGAWKEKPLVERIRRVMGALIERAKPDVVVVACNTASTIAITDLRASFTQPFVGTVPGVARTPMILDFVMAAAGFIAGTVPTKGCENDTRKSAMAMVEAVLHATTTTSGLARSINAPITRRMRSTNGFSFQAP